MKWSVLVLVAMGVAAAVSASALVASLRSPSSQAAPSQHSEPDHATIIVAKRDLSAMQVVDAASVMEKKLLPADVPPGALRSVEQAIGNVMITAALAGEPLRGSHFASGEVGVELAARLTEGSRAVTISLSQDESLQGLLYPGSVVDVLASFRLSGPGSKGTAISTTLLRGVQVLAIDRRTVVTEQEEPKGDQKSELDRERQKVQHRGNLITLLVNARQAEALQLADQYGTVSLAMRNPMDASKDREEGTLLNGGQLAKLAGLLSSVVTGEETEIEEDLLGPAVQTEPVAPKDEVAVAPAAPQPVAPPPIPQWVITVIRGDKYETRQFAVPAPRPTLEGTHDKEKPNE